MGAWIEIFTTVFLMLSTLSLPSWERGLKCICVVAVIRSGIVAPLVGAWIEIAKSGIDYQTLYVAPLVGAWIEICRFRSVGSGGLVAPLVGAWIEMLCRGKFCA